MKSVSTLSKATLALILSLCILNIKCSEEAEVENEGEEEDQSYRLCKKDLLFAYGIENPGYIKAPGMLCKHRLKESCCSRTAESQLLEKWINEDRIRMTQNIDGYLHILKGVFDYYEDIILFAKYVHMNPYSKDYCMQSSRMLIMSYMKKGEIEEFIENLTQAYKFLKDSRKGFYCSLCDVDYQKFFDTNAKKIIFKTSFCQELVENTIEANFERVNKVLPILQNINTLLLCQENEEENKINLAIQSIQFGLDQDDLDELNHCYNLYTEFKKPELYMTKCLDFCRDYKFSLGSVVYEGSLAKISFLYDKILKFEFAMTDPIFAEKNESKSFIGDDGVETVFYIRNEYDFTTVSNVYFNSIYIAQDLKSFESIFEDVGIDPVIKSEKSKFLFAHENYLELLKPNQFSNTHKLSFGFMLISMIGLVIKF